MKSLIVMLGLFSAVAFANTPDDLLQYWNHNYRILNAFSLNEGIPNKGVHTPFGTVYTKLTNLCQENGQIKTSKPITVCSKKEYQMKRCKNNESRMCPDKDEPKVCVEYRKVMGSANIKGTRKVCANLWDKEAREWRLRNDKDDFDNDYPDCSVFKTINTTAVTSYKFKIVSKRGYASDFDERRYGGALIDEFTYTIPMCNGTVAGK